MSLAAKRTIEAKGSLEWRHERQALRKTTAPTGLGSRPGSDKIAAAVIPPAANAPPGRQIPGSILVAMRRQPVRMPNAGSALAPMESPPSN